MNLILLIYTFFVEKARFTKLDMHSMTIPNAMYSQSIPSSDISTTNASKYLLEKGNDMRPHPPDRMSEILPLYIALLYEKSVVLQQLTSDEYSLLEKMEKIRCEYRHIIPVVNEMNEVNRYSARAGGLMDKWSAEADDWNE